MSKLTYAEQLRHPLWQRKRLEVLSLAGWACQCCAATDQTLHVHHKRYAKGRMAWEYSADELAALCETCHQETHHADDLFREVLAHCPMTGPRSMRSAMAIAAGFIGIHDATPDHLLGAFCDAPLEGISGWASGRMLDHMNAFEISALADSIGDPLFMDDLRRAIQAAKERIDAEIAKDLAGGGA